MEPIRTRVPRKPVLRSAIQRQAARPLATKPISKPANKPVKHVFTEPKSQAPRLSDTRRKWYIALGIVGLVSLAACVVLAVTGMLDVAERRFFALVNHAYLPAWVAEQIAKPVSNAVWGMVFLVAAFLAIPKFRLLAWQYAVAAGSAYVVTSVIEHIVDRARPVGLEGYDAVLRASQDGPGFPSGHVAVLAALGLTIWPFVSWPWRVFILVLVGTEAWSRVFLGVHAPLDVAGGVAVAAVVVAVIHLSPVKIRKIFKIAA